MAISDVELSKFSQFAYFNLPKKLSQRLKEGREISIKEVADYYIKHPDVYFQNITEVNGVKVPTESTNDISDGVDYQWNLLKKYSSYE